MIRIYSSRCIDIYLLLGGLVKNICMVMVKNKVRLCSRLFFLSCFFILCFLSFKKNIKSSSISKIKINKFLKKLKSREELRNSNRQNALQTQYKSNSIPFHFWISYFFYIYSISSLFLTLLSGVHLSKLCARYKVHGTELFWFILLFLLIRNGYDLFKILEYKWSFF